MKNYKGIKDITGEAILFHNPCKDSFDIFTKRFGFYEKVSIDKILDYDYIHASSKPSWVNFLLEYEFIVEEDGDLDKKQYGYGSKFTRNGHTYILAEVDTYQASLIDIETGEIIAYGRTIACGIDTRMIYH